jgi:hypothetical protein
MELKHLENIHEGSLGFVIGSGPSLRFVENSKISDYVSISVNSSFSKFNNADYFVADDIGVKNWNYYSRMLPLSTNTVSLLYRDKLKGHDQHLDPNRTVWYKHKWFYDPKNKTRNPDGLTMTSDGSLPVIGARTTAGSAVHIAHILGCNPIVLLGCDCCYEGTKRYYWQFPGETACFRITGERVFSFPNRGVHKGKPVDAHSMDFIDYWGHLAKAAEQQGIEVINASGGILDCFPRMSLDDVLAKFGDRKKRVS